jgi:acetoin utilization deacetylase AcuC-like enzyme
MIDREQLVAAVASIAASDPEAGVALRNLLESGRLVAVADAAVATFRLDDETVSVRRHQYIHQGLPALVERLALAFGTWQARQGQAETAPGYQRDRSRRLARRSGLEYQLNLSLAAAEQECRLQVEAEPADGERAAALTLLEDLHGEFPGAALPWNPSHHDVFFKGVVDVDTAALFCRFPFTRDGLLQVADRNLEFFNLRFVLEHLLRGEHRNLFCCVVHGRLVGMMTVRPVTELGRRELEVQWLATSRGGPTGAPARGEWVHRGAGALLLAGAWLLWKIYEPRLGGLVVQSEPAAVDFYESLGFSHARPHVFHLDDPRGQFLRNIVAMANRLEELPIEVQREISFMVRRQARALIAAEVSNPYPQPDTETRRLAGAFFFEECFRASRSRPWAGEAAAVLVERAQGLPGGEELLRCAHEYGLVQQRGVPEPRKPLLLVIDDRFGGHLEKITSFESGKRLRALLTVLEDPELSHRWRKLPPRQATVEELMLVHTREHVVRTVGTMGPVTQPDSQVVAETVKVQDTALFAVGGWLELLDAVVQGRANRGFALVRPPGHHAEPDQALGFCFFNNVAIGARHLQRRHGLERILVLDIDAHHGNGTQRVFWEDPSVLYVSIHRAGAYPFTGAAEEVGEGPGRGFTVNVPIDRRVGDRDYARILAGLLDPIARQFRPELLLVSCGFDLHHKDPLGQLSLTAEGYRLITDLILRLAQDLCGGKTAFVLEGGYSVGGIKDAGRRVIRRLADLDAVEPEVVERLREAGAVGVPGLKQVFKVQREFWRLD